MQTCPLNEQKQWKLGNEKKIVQPTRQQKYKSK